MNNNLLKILGVGLGFIIMFLSGFWLNRTGKPYGTLVFAVHKLIGVGLGIFLYITVKQLHPTSPLSVTEIILIALIVLSFIGTVTTGSLLSVPVSKPMPAMVSTMNKIFPYITVLFTLVPLYLLLNRK